ncbi:hypothetical protein AB656_05585 [Bifidobacterium actinocoloniiforme DSM 22766]|nr:hypothetical protein AB656_05585 [Bifidobacterium actinocoloniiforme DSM 22766]
MAKAMAAVLVIVFALAAAGCGSSGPADGAVEITLWTWQSTIDDFTRAYSKTHPGVRVKAVNVGSNEKEYMQLTNAIAAGKGVPDLVYMDYNAVQQYAVSSQLHSVDEHGFDSISDDFTLSSLANVSYQGKHYGLPISAGPMVMFYNSDLLTRAGVNQPPATWQAYAQAARKLADLDAGVHITSDSGDANFLTSMLWQAGSRPFKVDGTHLSIGFSDQGARRFTGMWQPLLDQRLVDTKIKMWDESWYKALDDGRIATVLTGAWLATSLKKNVKAGEGHWRIAPIPQYEAQPIANAENGGGALVLPAAADRRKVDAAYDFARWFAHEGGVQVNLNQDGIPPLATVLNGAEFRDKTDPYFGGQRTGQIISDAAAQISSGWTHLPYMVYGSQIAANSVGKAYLGKCTLNQALIQWGQDLSDYGRQQGFTVN